MSASGPIRKQTVLTTSHANQTCEMSPEGTRSEALWQGILRLKSLFLLEFCDTLPYFVQTIVDKNSNFG
jgi:hypothetical protein